MPICKTCHGEYERRECLCPHCFKSLGRGENLCHHCGADTRGVRLCARCKSDVSAWERERFSLAQFMSRWGALALAPSAGALLLWWLFWMPKGESLHSLGMALVALASSQLVLILLYIKHLFWRERWWAAQVYRVRLVSLPVAIGSTFIAGGVCAVAAFAILRTAGEPEVWQWWHKPLFGVTYSLAFPWFTATLTLMAIQDYLNRLDERVPQPLFVHTHRLLRVVLETAIKNLRVLDNGEAALQRQYEVVEVVRLPDDGGIQVVLRELRPNLLLVAGEEARWIEKIWYIQADCWGRVQSLQPQHSMAGQENHWRVKMQG